MKKILLAMICGLFSLPMLCEEHDLQALLHKLDDAIEQSDVIEQQHRKAIENLLKMFDEAVDDKIRYKFCLDLFFQYKKCNLDSMYIYAKEGWLLAKKMDDYEKIQSSMLNVADAYKKLARYDEALNILKTWTKTISVRMANNITICFMEFISLCRKREGAAKNKGFIALCSVGIEILWLYMRSQIQ